MLSKVTNNINLDMLIDVLNSNKQDFENYYKTAEIVTQRNFGKKRKLFNPIYLSNICLADCPYCGYRISNKGFFRKTLKAEEAIQEAEFLQQRGVNNLLILAGDYKHAKYIEMLSENIKAIKNRVQPKWIGLEVATLEIEDYKTLLKAGVDCVIIFQETYNRTRYDILHKNPEHKGDFIYRYNAQERAIQAGIKQVGFGVLYGIGYWMDDTIAMAEHALTIKTKYPYVKLSFSFPRLQISTGQSEDCRTESITEEQLLKVIVGMRLLFPDASLTLTGRESLPFLIEHAKIVTTLGFKGETSVGGYSINKGGLKQFDISGTGDFKVFSDRLLKAGYEF